MLYQGAEGASTMLVVLKLIEARTGRSQQHDVSRLGEAAGTIHRILEGLAGQYFDGGLYMRADLFGRSAYGVDALHPFPQQMVHQRVVAVLVLAAEDEVNVAGKRLDGFDGGIDIGGLRIVVVLNSGNRSDVLKSMV